MKKQCTSHAAEQEEIEYKNHRTKLKIDSFNLLRKEFKGKLFVMRESSIYFVLRFITDDTLEKLKCVEGKYTSLTITAETEEKDITEGFLRITLNF